MVEPYGTGADFTQHRTRMRYDQQRVPCLAEAHHFLEVFLLKCPIADSEHFIHNQHIGIDVHCYGKSEPHHHARRIGPQRFMYEIAELCKLDDLIEQHFGSKTTRSE